LDTLVKKAYDHWDQVVEYDGKSLMSFKENKKSGTLRNDQNMGIVDYSNALNHQLPLPRLPVPLEQPPLDSGLPVGGKSWWLH